MIRDKCINFGGFHFFSVVVVSVNNVININHMSFSVCSIDNGKIRDF